MALSNKPWEQLNEGDKIYWLAGQDEVGTFIFTFDKEREYNLFLDYPYKLTPEQKAIFDKENPEWAEFFKDRLLTEQ